MKRLCLTIFLIMLAACGCGHEIKEDAIDIKAPQRIPLLIIKDYVADGNYLQKSWYWRGFWDIQSNSISLEERPLFEPQQAMAGGYNSYHFAWDGSDQLVLTHGISNKKLGVLKFAPVSEGFSIDTYMVNTLSDSDYAVSFRDKNQQSTYTAYAGETGLTVLCRSQTGNHWNLSVVGKDTTPLLLTDTGADEAGLLLVYRNSNGRQSLSWLNVKANDRRWSSIETDIPEYISPSSGELLVDACIIGDKVYLSSPGGNIYSLVIKNNAKDDIKPVRAVKEKEISSIAASQWDRNTHAHTKYAKLGAYRGILLVSINGADGSNQILAFRDGKLLGKTVLNKGVDKHYIGVILPQENYGTLFNGG